MDDIDTLTRRTPKAVVVARANALTDILMNMQNESSTGWTLEDASVGARGKMDDTLRFHVRFLDAHQKATKIGKEERLPKHSVTEHGIDATLAGPLARARREVAFLGHGSDLEIQASYFEPYSEDFIEKCRFLGQVAREISDAGFAVAPMKKTSQVL